MKSCGYCGRENADEVLFCPECGTELPDNTPPEQAASPAQDAVVPPPLPQLPSQRGRLNATSATVILVIYLAAQFAAGVVVAVLGHIVGAAQRINLPDTLQLLNERIFAAAAVLGMIAGGVMMIASSLSAVPSAIRDLSPTGAAWVFGPWKRVIVGFFLGMLMALSLIAFTAFASLDAPEESLGPLARMASRPGVGQIAWVLIALLIAPVVEELLFRGVLYGGYRQSMGPRAAAIITTGGFVLLHALELRIQPLAGFWIGGLAVVALWLRLRSGAIGPAVAAHFGYNAVIAGLVVYATR